MDGVQWMALGGGYILQWLVWSCWGCYPVGRRVSMERLCLIQDYVIFGIHAFHYGTKSFDSGFVVQGGGAGPAVI